MVNQPVENGTGPSAHSIIVNDSTPPVSPAVVTSPTSKSPRPPVFRAPNSFSAVPAPKPLGSLYPPATLKGIDADGLANDWDESMGEGDMVLELADGLALSGHSFGANKSIAGECVFQTGKSDAARVRTAD